MFDYYLLTQDYFEVHPSPIQGLGAFAVRPIPKGTRIIEYTGERITPEQADERYDDDAVENPRTYLFTVDKKTLVDATHEGNEARFINHSCEPNCEAVIEDKRIYIEAVRDIAPGEELTYDYHLERPGRFRKEWRELYACHCGAPNCRGILLELRKRRPRKAAGKPRKAGQKIKTPRKG